MKKLKEVLIENDFGAYLCDLREKKGYTVEELSEIINMPSASIKSIKKWEHDLEFPNLDVMYKLSEIYQVPSVELIQVRTNTLEEGLKGVHKTIIRLIGYALGISIYGTVILSYITIGFFAIWSLFFLKNAVNNMTDSFRGMF